MPKIIIVSGPNGAGKTSFARELLAATPDSYAFVNADEIARELRIAGEPPANIDIAAARSSLDYLERHYKPIVDEWYVCDSLEGDVRISLSWRDA